MSRDRTVARAFFAALALAGCVGSSMPKPPPAPQTEPAPPPPASPPMARAAGYDAALTGYDYPFEVKRFATKAQGQALTMSYMLVDPPTPNGRTVTLLHGKNFSGAYWEATARALLARGYRVVMPDQIGFGKSDKPLDFQYSFHQLATLTLDLLTAIGVQQTDLVGHSMGGMLATRLALTAPSRVHTLTLVNPIGLEDWQRKVPYVSVDAWHVRNAAATPATIKAYMQKSYFGGEWKPAYDALLTIQAGWAIGPDAEHIARVSALHYDMIFTQPVVHELGDLKVPTLLVIGQRDRTALGKSDVSADVAAELGDYPALGTAAAAAIDDAELVALDDVGHVPQIEAFDAWAAALLGFLDRRAPQ